MKKSIKILLIIVTILMILPNHVFAHSAAGGTNNNSYGSCDVVYNGKALDWCFGNIGFRFSLYKYKSGNLTYYGSQDYESNKPGLGTLDGRTATIVEASAGKVAYMNKKAAFKWSSEVYTLDVRKSTLTCYFEGSCKNFADYAKNEIETYFKLNSEPLNEKSILTQLKTMFGKSIKVEAKDLYYMYVTVEPTIYIYNKKGVGYYGTIYELMNAKLPREGKSLFGIDEILYQTFPNSIIATNPTTKDINNFVSSDSRKNPKVLIVGEALPYTVGGKGIDWTNDSANSARLSNRNKIVSNQGYGIGVFWVGAKIPPPNDSCKKTCSGKKDNTLLQCAENYCAKQKYSTATKKADCIVKLCGYTKPASYECGKTSNSKSTTTKCADEVSNSLKTCKTTTYFKTECTEKTELSYPSLPKRNSLHVGDSYKASYSISTTGSKTCTTKFNYKLFEFNYASQVSNEGRTNLVTSMNNNAYFSKAVHSKSLKYDVSEDAWDTRKFNNSSKNFTLKWDSKSYSEKLTSNTKQHITFFANGKKTTSKSKHYVSKTTLSKNSGILYNNAIPYITSSEGKKTTKIYVERKSSGLNDTNTCFYKIGENKEELNCTASIIDTEPFEGDTYFGKVKIEYKITYKVNDLEGDYNNLRYSFKKNDSKEKVKSTTITREIEIKEKNGESVKSTMYLEKKSDSDVSNSCSITIKAPETPAPDPICSLNLTPNSGTKKLKVSSNKSVYKRPLECKVEFYDGTEKIINVTNDTEYFDYVGDEENALELKESNPAVKVTCAFDLGLPNEACPQVETIGSCGYIRKANKDLVRKYCNNYESLEGGSGCYDKCTCPRYPNATEEEVNDWCRFNWESEGYTSEAMCKKDCGPDQIQPSKYIFRPITLGKNGSSYNAFPNREAGSNWTMSEYRTEDDSFDKEEPLYTITLDSAKIKAVREDTKAKTKTKAYIPYEHATEENKKCFTSSLIDETGKFAGLINVGLLGWKGCD